MLDTYVSFTNSTYVCWMMLYPFIVISIPLQYCGNNHIASCCNYCSEYFQYHPTLIMIQYTYIVSSSLTVVIRDKMLNKNSLAVKKYKANEKPQWLQVTKNSNIKEGQEVEHFIKRLNDMQ